MKKLCFKCYMNILATYGLLTILLFVLAILLKELFMTILFSSIGLITFAFFIYYIRIPLIYLKQSKNLKPEIGVISDWHALPSRYDTTARVSLKTNDAEYHSPHYFTNKTARDMVGKQVLYVVVNNVLLIYEILN